MQEVVLQASLAAAYNYFQSINHQQNMVRIKELAQKLKAGEYGVAFAGHFSAGKSRMINMLLGENILPSSPVPTSANLVKVHRGKAGEDYARVFFHREKPRKYLAPYNYDLLRSFCRDGDQIAAIDICRSTLDLPEQVVIMDTPGIDSVDEAHRKATEAALHLADVILFVMDYNHVQAELNLSFTRDLTAAGKEVYLLINQIDKHVESELSFASFRQGVEKAFLDWGVRPAGFFYTSLKQLEHPHNQFPLLQKMLMAKIAARDDLLKKSIEASLKKILQEYERSEEHAAQEHLAEAYAALEDLPEEKIAQLKQDYARLTDELAELQGDWENGFDEGVQKILDNAYLMPTSTRDLAKVYLEACQPDFKVGLFTRGKKTLAELARRKNAFFDDASEKVQAQLTWHIKAYFADFAKQHHIDSEELTAYIESLEILPSEELLTEAMRSGARLTQDGSYVMNYTANFAEGTKEIARKIALAYKNKVADLLAERNAVRAEEVAKQLENIEKYHQAWSAIDEAKQKQADLGHFLQGLLTTAELPANWEEVFTFAPLDEEIVLPMGKAVAARNGAAADFAQGTGQTAESESLDKNVGNSSTEAGSNISAGENTLVADAGASLDGGDNAAAKGSNRTALKHWAAKLRHASQLIGHVPMLSQLASELSERADRLDNKGFMVTLFGAFSAGKSSFANSLLGVKLLPVSPNPTTAAINKICPVDAEHPHGTLIIKLKDEAMLLADVNRALKAFGMATKNMADALARAKEALADTTNDKQREKAFLRAFLAGYAKSADRLGKKLTKGLEDLPVYAAREERSCFVDWLEAYYDCPFTRLGITLVDTPGADSINARHTNMSFNYIRQSDVVLFVTYYNHAFSRADREFIIQLGRVKDAFVLDKMFFIVNALDLAENATEAASVIDYVSEQLKKYGVKKPQIYGVSSKQILQAKLQGQTEGFEFETAFYKFVFEELTGIAVNAAAGEYELAKERVAELIRLGRSSAAEKEMRCQKLTQMQAQCAALLANITATEMQNRQRQELSELVYYVKQRVFLRYADFYREAFNSALFREKGNAQGKLRGALEELLGSMGFDFAQELRATVLRMEQWIRSAAGNLQQQINGKLLEIKSELPISRKEFSYTCDMEFAPAFAEADRGIFSKSLAIYKNAKGFFEEGGTREMSAALENVLRPLADAYLAEQEKRLAENLQNGVDTVFEQVKSRFQRRLREKFAADFAALDGGVPLAELMEIAEKLN